MTSNGFYSLTQLLSEGSFWLGGLLTAVTLGILLTARPCRSKWFLATALALSLTAGAGYYGLTLLRRFDWLPADPVLPMVALGGSCVLRLLAGIALLAFVVVWKRELERGPTSPSAEGPPTPAPEG